MVHYLWMPPQEGFLGCQLVLCLCLPEEQEEAALRSSAAPTVLLETLI